MNEEQTGFYPFKAFCAAEEWGLTAAMEDYLEMLTRLAQNGKEIRLKELAEVLNVKPSSASKMMSRLREKGFADFRRYGSISLTEKGRRAGQYLILRHEVVHSFLCRLNQSENELAQTERIEHFLDMRTVLNLKRLLDEHSL